MSIPSFLKLVEIQTKIASVFPFMLGTLFVVYQYDLFKPVNTLIFFGSMLIFDLTTTAINNYMDYRKATDNHDYDYRTTSNVIGQERISERTVIITIFLMFFSATGLGVWLVVRTDLLVLLIGFVCFCIGILYTFGPVPLSRVPLGEIFSGVTMGFGIFFLAVYVNAYDAGIANLLWQGEMITIQFNLIEIIRIGVLSLPCIFTIANIMLANNLCDLDEDIRNHRYTLPYYIGRKMGIVLFNGLYYASFVAVIVSVIVGFLHPIMLLSLLVAYPVYRNLVQFNKEQVKSKTFVIGIRNFVLINATLTILMAVSVALQQLV
ncbi:1,4-dihydroxy-2-naphthoate polyprenyltransferase [Listeria ivanovii]|uniref:1,4-dihydroxy-2-naphthoate polyprenyltransferase n=1 Tax=Listeria ivanovii TaxID=1638 RepID=UPI000DA9F28F|nr:1,4-dihydroxy-2-naphthoate polyprenyltransferase [Listeria ivanovii]PZF88508.1 1,4-dihydroxy-2-naphthoate polyprenyltransferase [Listeria ivanovii]PZF93677.1 1,4-dihydroxy-2-naphthoate polyprenyltransferase [Listeria ivanovii]PZG04440.1 1,4-dihydroxy-2-naphthoate polyprenyltransferase [Listeria ivanovii]PZG08861.1 1,4-dihydroxy-2-naphthoate polyprenyltransferase [Listeria ivanovii]PZG25806.1 1,4-dihydroxy-2-naphthoate polyprenyltransferase [Listeria ivanovii]